MKLRKLTSVLSLTVTSGTVPTPRVIESNQVSYIIGAVIALFILGYLIYTLFKPDKF